jgi:hypothetical protein
LPRRHSRLGLALGNAGLGSLTAIVGHVVRGKPVRVDKVVQGAVAGGFVYAGKAIVADNSWPTNLLGRELAAVGSSAVLNAAAGRGIADRVLLPWGPFRVHIDRHPRTRVRVKLDVARTATMIAGITDDKLAPDIGSSLLNGVLILRNETPTDRLDAVGSHVGGVIKYRVMTSERPATDREVRSIVGHEMVHVIQADFLFNVLAEPAESYVFGRSSLGRYIHRYIDLGINVPLSAGMNRLVPYARRPWEREAVSLAEKP